MKPTTTILLALSIFGSGAITGGLWIANGYEEDRQHTDRVLFEAAGYRSVKVCTSELKPSFGLAAALNNDVAFFRCLNAAVQQVEATR